MLIQDNNLNGLDEMGIAKTQLCFIQAFEHGYK